MTEALTTRYRNKKVRDVQVLNSARRGANNDTIPRRWSKRFIRAVALNSAFLVRPQDIEMQLSGSGFQT